MSLFTQHYFQVVPELLPLRILRVSTTADPRAQFEAARIEYMIRKKSLHGGWSVEILTPFISELAPLLPFVPTDGYTEDSLLNDSGY